MGDKTIPPRHGENKNLTAESNKAKHKLKVEDRSGYKTNISSNGVTNMPNESYGNIQEETQYFSEQVSYTTASGTTGVNTADYNESHRNEQVLNRIKRRKTKYTKKTFGTAGRQAGKNSRSRYEGSRNREQNFDTDNIQTKKRRRKFSQEYYIKRDALKNYDRTTRPVINDTTTTHVSIGMSLYHILDTVSSKNIVTC